MSIRWRSSHCDSRSSSMKRRRILLFIFIFWIGSGLLLALGLAVPRLFIGDGLRRFTEVERWVAENALDASGQCFDHPIQRGMALRKRVARVEFGPFVSDSAPSHATAFALVRTHTLFGIPTGSVSVWQVPKTFRTKPQFDSPRPQSQKLAAQTSPNEQFEEKLQCRITGMGSFGLVLFSHLPLGQFVAFPLEPSHESVLADLDERILRRAR